MVNGALSGRLGKRSIKTKKLNLKVMPMIRLKTPLSETDIETLKAGDFVLITGVIYGARDLVHNKFMELIEKGEDLPIMLKGQVIYYTGVSPAPPGKVVGAAGPTSSYRMDKYALKLLEMGVKGFIGKGPRAEFVKKALIKHKAIYMSAIGGAAALLSKTIKRARIVAYREFGPEALMEFYVEDFPAFVVNDIYGNDLYIEGQKRYRVI